MYDYKAQDCIINLFCLILGNEEIPGVNVLGPFAAREYSIVLQKNGALVVLVENIDP